MLAVIKTPFGVHCRPKYLCFSPFQAAQNLTQFLTPQIVLNFHTKKLFSGGFGNFSLKVYALNYSLCFKTVCDNTAKYMRCKSDAQMEMALTHDLNNWVCINFFLSWCMKINITLNKNIDPSDECHKVLVMENTLFSKNSC